jgi:cyclic-di-GMP-binding protein
VAQQFSFDIVSEVNLQEVDNALNQARKEISQRYDFKGIATTLDFSETDKTITLTTGDEFHLKSAVDILQTKLIKRGVHVKALKYGSVENAAGGAVRQIITLRIGIDKEDSKMIVKMIKDSKIKVQPQIMDDQIRVSGKDKDDLQKVIKLVNEANLSFATQFANYR